MPIFCVKSVKIYTSQKNLHGYIRGRRDKYEVWSCTCLTNMNGLDTLFGKGETVGIAEIE